MNIHHDQHDRTSQPASAASAQGEANKRYNPPQELQPIDGHDVYTLWNAHQIDFCRRIRIVAQQHAQFISDRD